jgi:peptide/nickel transport system permease protein
MGSIVNPVEPSAAVLPDRRGTVRRLLADRSTAVGLAILAAYLLIAFGVAMGWWAEDWSAISDQRWAPPSNDHWLGTNLIGQDILDRALASTRTAFDVGLVVAAAATLIGTVLGGLAGFVRLRGLDASVLWLIGTLEAIPFYLFVAAVAYALDGHPWAMQAAMTATFWTATARLVRAEVLRLKQRPFVEAARSIGLPEWLVLVRHVLPNTAPTLIIQATLTFVAAIKAEVILSFLGLGVQDGVSWGLMIAEASQEVLGGYFMNFLAASGFLFVLVLGVNLLADGVQAQLDPRRGGRR